MRLVRSVLVPLLFFTASSASAQALRLTKPAVRLSHQFSVISGFRELADGAVLVSDGIDDVLLRINLSTQRIDTVGRAGQGPGEYRSPDALFALPNGATLMVDLGNARLASYDAAGRYRESFPIVQGQPGSAPGPIPMVIPRAIDGQGRIYFQPPPFDPRADSGAIVRWDRSASRFDTVARVRLPALVTKSSGGPNSRRMSQRPPPYPSQEAWTAGPDGRVAIVRAPIYRVDWIAANGARVVGKPVSTTPVPVRDPEKKEYLAEQATNGLSVSVSNVNGQVSMQFRRGTANRDDDDEADLSGPEWPSTKPAVTGVLSVAPDGRLWVERSVAAGAPRIYDVVGPAGEVQTTVTLPPGRRLLAVGAHGLYARQLDSDGISYLERYDLK